MARWFFLTLLTVTVAVVVQSLDAHGQGQGTPANFDRHVAPILARRCLGCHNGSAKKGGLDLSRRQNALAGGDNGPVIVPGKAEQSLLVRRILSEEMPPKNPLPKSERAVLQTWVASGAKWGSDPIDPFLYTSDSRAGYDWWALQPIARPGPPKVKHANWPHSPLDFFVLARLEASGLGPSPPADRRTLIRRVSLDLLGLPPTPEAVEAFLADRSADAYEKLIDKLLDSPHYGERWARHWLDIVHFGESQGFERDKIRPNFWRYRDWVVDALNHDLPYDEFARLQLAGDVLRPSDADAVIATGFLVTGSYDEVGHNQQSSAMKAVVRQDELEDITGMVGQTFLGLTVNCARCHDHKFDPIRQAEYYRMTAALAGAWHGERDVATAPLREQATNQAAEIDKQLDGLAKQLAAIEQPVVAQVLKGRKKKQSKVKPPTPIARWEFDGNLQDSIGKLHGTAHGSARVEQGRLVLDGKGAYVATEPLASELKEKTLEAWVQLSNLDQRGGGVLSLQANGGEVFDAIVFGEREPRRWMAGSNGFVRTKSFGGSEETQAHETMVHVAIVYYLGGVIQGYLNGQPYGRPYTTTGPVIFKSGSSQVLLGLRHSPPGGNRFLAGMIDRAALYDRALAPEEVAASAGTQSNDVPEKEIVARLSPRQRERREQLKLEINHLRMQRNRAAATNVYTVSPKQPGPVHLLKRGNPAAKGPEVTPGGVAAVKGVNADFALSGNAPDKERRLRLARWITDANNPLFARVIVNRLWQYHFGIGIVDTPSDFGFNGGRPTHPQLIDWLASELIREKWSLKQLHRTILLSATYQQSSGFNAAAAKVDAGNRLLWRKSPLRLEAEALRDAILSVTGQLNGKVGGPGYQDFTTFVNNTQFYTMTDPVGASFNRRSLYRTWIRSGRNRFLDAFDCPDPSTKAPKRAVTTTPLQALSLMNNSFVLRMSQRFAERLRREAGDDAAKQVRRAYDLAYGRPAADNELTLIERFITDNGLPAFCRVVFNSNEFLYVD